MSQFQGPTAFQAGADVYDTFRGRYAVPLARVVAVCAGRLSGVEVVTAGAEQLPSADDSFDLALSQLVLHFVADPHRAVVSLDPAAPDEARVLRFGGPGEIVGLLQDFGLVDLDETTLAVESTNADFEELWSGFLAGVGPAGVYCPSLTDHGRDRLRSALSDRLEGPSGPPTQRGVARCVTAHVAA